jgi:hypothetical protein
LIAGWRSRCKSAFPATVMIAGVVSASTLLVSQIVPLRRTRQSRWIKKTVDHTSPQSHSRSRSPDSSCFSPPGPSFLARFGWRGLENTGDYCRE